MVEHLVHGDGRRTAISQHHHTQTVTHQDNINSGLIHQPRPGIVIGSQGGDGGPLLLAAGNVRNGELFYLHCFLLRSCVVGIQATRWLAVASMAFKSFVSMVLTGVAMLCCAPIRAIAPLITSTSVGA